VAPGRIVDVGCGSAIYLAHALAAAPAAHGLGVDLQSAVLTEAEEHLTKTVGDLTQDAFPRRPTLAPCWLLGGCRHLLAVGFAQNHMRLERDLVRGEVVNDDTGYPLA